MTAAFTAGVCNAPGDGVGFDIKLLAAVLTGDLHNI